MNFARPALLLAGLLLACGAHAQAIEKVNVDTVSINAPIPAGYCKVPRESRLGQNLYPVQERMQSGINLVLLVFADCNELKALEAGKAQNLVRYGMYLAPLSNGQVTRIPAGMSRQQAIDDIAKTIPALDLADMQSKSNARTSKEGVTLEKVTTGLLGKDANALYVAVGANAQAGGAQATRFRGVVLITVLKNLAVSCNLYGPVEAGTPYEKMLAAQKANAAALIKAN